MKKQTKMTPEQKHKQVQLKAYELWQQAGSPLGRDQEFWYTAVAVLDTPQKKKISASSLKKNGGCTR